MRIDDILYARLEIWHLKWPNLVRNCSNSPRIGPLLDPIGPLILIDLNRFFAIFCDILVSETSILYCNTMRSNLRSNCDIVYYISSTLAGVDRSDGEEGDEEGAAEGAGGDGLSRASLARASC